MVVKAENPNDGLNFVPSENEMVESPQTKTHILTVCQKFIILFLIAEEPKVISLEFASKVIHGVDLPPELQKSRARRLYDVSNGNYNTVMILFRNIVMVAIFFQFCSTAGHKLKISHPEKGHDDKAH